MFSKSRMLGPVLRRVASVNDPLVNQSRNVWDLMRPTPLRSLVRDFERQMDRFERDFFLNSPLSRLAPRFVPVELADMKNDTYRVNIDVSGFKPEDIKISMKDNLLTIRAKADTTTEDGHRLQQEITREFTLPEGVDHTTLKSLFHNEGILIIEAALRQPEPPKEIPIESSK